ncbi:MAG TPA: beta-propeller fold lactonase family protein [Blastocatellia bacterium]|nr:beta-propeller fold lactonase family protein [Blastocatellia bacterium]
MNRIVAFAHAFAAALLVVLVSVPACAARRVPIAEPADPHPPGISFVPLPGHPFSAITTSDGKWLFVSVTTSNPTSVNGVAMLRLDGAKATLEKVFLVEGEPTGMVMTHDDKTLIVADGDYVVFMDVGRMTSKRDDPILGYISDGDYPGSVYVNVTTDDRFLFVSDEGVQTITVINLQKARADGFNASAIVGKIPVGIAPIALTFSPDGRWLYTTSQVAPKSYGWPVDCKPEGGDPATATPQKPQGAVIVVDVARAQTDPANAVIARAPSGCNPVRLAISPGGERVYVTARNSNALLAFDAAKLRTDSEHALIGKVAVGTSPVGVAVVNDGKQVLVTNSNRFSSDRTARQTLTVIDAAKVAEGQSAVITNIPAGAFPREFGRSPNGRVIFVANYSSSEIQIIDLDRVTF